MSAMWWFVGHAAGVRAWSYEPEEVTRPVDTSPGGARTFSRSRDPVVRKSLKMRRRRRAAGGTVFDTTSSGHPMRLLRHTAPTWYRYVLILTALAVSVGWPGSARAQTLTSVLTYPANLATNADMTLPIQWTGVANAQAYYLYVGSTFGGKDLVNTGETLQTSELALNLPDGQTLYARLWTKAGNVWRYIDSTFSAAPAVRATLTYPSDGAVNMDPVNPIQWTSVANVQAYYLYVGTTLGAKDVVNTGEIQQTSFLAANLPLGQT